MRLRSLVQDALYLNWALPSAALPRPPRPLRYERFGCGDAECVFATALLFRHRGVHLPHLPFLRFTYPQMNLRLYATDAEGVPSVLFLDMLMPRWVGPAVRWVGRQPASSARLAFPRPSLAPEEGEWTWRVEQGDALEVVARRGAPGTGEGPVIGPWQDTVRYFRERPRGYVATDGEVRRIETEHPPVAVWPMTAEVTEGSLLRHALPLGDGLPRLHSAWLCPEIPFVFQLSLVPRVELEARMPRAAPSTRSRLSNG